VSPKSKPEIREAVLGALSSVAPELDPGTLDPKQPLREQLDLDSMDFLNYAVALHSALGIDVPERDYAKIATLDGSIDYVSVKLAGA
jgi:acyl carrier protein